jgi:NADPH2:quinone reductase
MPTMKAIVVEKFGGLEALQHKDVEKPKPTKGFATIRIKAFGLNHAEVHMRKDEWAEAMPIIGIECVGIVEACPGGEFAPGTAVAAFMGGLGRTINGTYAEYTNAVVGSVILLGDNPLLPWEEIAALPESYSCAWVSLFKNLDLQPGETLLIRRATSAFGKAAVNLAVSHGAKVTATTRNESKFKELYELGVDKVVQEKNDLGKSLGLEKVDPVGKFDKCLNLVGNSVLLETLWLIKRHGRYCHAGWLGGLTPVKDFDPLLQMAPGVHFSLFASPYWGIPEWPTSEVPLREIVTNIADGKFNAKPARVFKFDEIQEAHRVMEAAEAGGKLVILGYDP